MRNFIILLTTISLFSLMIVPGISFADESASKFWSTALREKEAPLKYDLKNKKFIITSPSKPNPAYRFFTVTKVWVSYEKGKLSYLYVRKESRQMGTPDFDPFIMIDEKVFKVDRTSAVEIETHCVKWDFTVKKYNGPKPGKLSNAEYLENWNLKDSNLKPPGKAFRDKNNAAIMGSTSYFDDKHKEWGKYGPQTTWTFKKKGRQISTTSVGYEGSVFKLSEK